MNRKALENLFRNSQELKKPANVKGLITKKEIDELKSLLLDIIRNFIHKDQMHVGLKTYINQELRNDITDRMWVLPPTQNDTLETWSQQIFGEEKFGMVLNYLEEFSNTFAEKAANIVSPLLKIAGLPLEGLSFLFFMGNYGFTPFGIHKEARGEEGVLFHLGPGRKQFYAWDEPKLNAIEHNTNIFHNVEEMLPSAQKYELEPGDAMFIPHSVYHVANTSEFSISFVTDYINPPMDQLEKKLFRSLADEEITLKSNSYLSPLKIENKPLELDELLNSSSIKIKMETALKRLVYDLMSNGGILRKSKINNSRYLPSGNFTFKGKIIFPLFIDNLENNQVLIFARGHRFTKKQHSNLSSLINTLNSGKMISLVEFREFMEPGWDLIDIFGFIGDLLKVEAISVEE